jgi:hypothetical protein
MNAPELAADRENIRQRAERMQQLVSENVILRRQLKAEQAAINCMEIRARNAEEQLASLLSRKPRAH